MYKDSAIQIVQVVRSLYPDADNDVERFRLAMKDLLVTLKEYEQIKAVLYLQDGWKENYNFFGVR